VVIRSWLNRMLLPDAVVTGGDSHTRFPLGISFPAGSGLGAFAAATGVMTLDMPESILVRFKGEMQPGTWLHFAFKAHQDRLWHIQCHHTGRCGKRPKTRACRE
ncbi:hypothetical protein UF06_10315, partial [Vibrio sp. S234-5]